MMRRVFENRLFQHLIFWIASFIVLLRIFSEEFMWNRTDMIYTVLFLTSITCAVYINHLLLMPKFWIHRKWILYGMGIVFLIPAATLLNEFIFNILADLIFPGYYFISYYSFWEIAQFITAFLIISILLKLSKSWFELQNAQKQVEALKLSSQASELKALKNQINPHFLFNNLHTIYALTYQDQQTAGQAILKLSDILRYMLYDTSREKVTLAKEIKCILDYVDLQKLRISENIDIQINIKKDGAEKIEIAPLLFMPLVENAFKHGISSNDDAHIHLALDFNGRELQFSVHNSKGAKPDSQNSGIGINNLVKRLNLLYADKHNLFIHEDSEIYDLRLTLDYSI